MVPHDGSLLPHLVSGPSLGNRTGGAGDVPWQGPKGEPPGFLFGVSLLQGEELRASLRRGKVVLQAHVKATTAPGEYKQVEGVIHGTDPSLKEISDQVSHQLPQHRRRQQSHRRRRDTISRVLNTLIATDKLPRPRRTIRFQ